LLKKIVKDILDCGFEIRSIAESMAGKIDENEEVKGLISKMGNYMDELEEIGCYYKDWSYSIGLVDFPSIIDGKEVLLCWRSDEPEIMFYYPIYEGYVGRKEIPEEYR